MNTVKNIEFQAGTTIESAVEILKDYNDNGVLVKGDFNGVTLYSNTVTLDSAYLSIMGKSYAEYKMLEKQEYDNHLKEEKEYKKNLPSKIQNWIKEGKKVLEPEYLEEWNKIVPVRAGDLYHGLELDCSLDIIKSLNNGEPYEKAVEIMKSQGHSGMSASLVSYLVKHLCKRGQSFLAYI